MNKFWEKETSQMLERINDETEKLLTSNLTTDEFQRKHQELMDFWQEASKRIQENYELLLKPKARPKHNHSSNHMSEKYKVRKALSKFE